MGGYGPIQTKYDESEYFPITIDRIQVIQHIIVGLGAKTKGELVSISKKCKPYCTSYIQGKKQIISKSDMEKTEFTFPSS